MMSKNGVTLQIWKVELRAVYFVLLAETRVSFNRPDLNAPDELLIYIGFCNQLSFHGSLKSLIKNS